jgi:hypothetical protein
VVSIIVRIAFRNLESEPPVGTPPERKLRRRLLKFYTISIVESYIRDK